MREPTPPQVLEVGLPRRTRLVIAVAGASGLVSFSVAVVSFGRRPSVDPNQLVLFATLAALVVAMWTRPLVMYRGAQSEAVNLDEGVVLVAALLLPSAGTILVFALATALAQALRRRPLVKSIFNWGQVVTAAGVAVAVTRALAPPTPRLTGAELAAAAAGAVAFSVVNSCAIATIVASLGTRWWVAIRDGVGIRARLVGSCVAVASVSSLAISTYRWSLPLAVLPLLVLRQILAGHFESRHDRERMLGLFNAALEANRSLGEGDVLGAVRQSARDLLRCAGATVTRRSPGPGELGAVMLVSGEPSWLVVSGRSRSEPFDSADATLLEALAAVGAGALTNGRNYREGRFQRERPAITSSLGEGVCALDRWGHLTFTNPAGATMLGGDPRSIPESLLAPARRVMRTRETVRGDDTELRRPDGSCLPVAFTASAILDENEVAGAVIVFRDISERREAERAIRDARDHAIEASRLKSQFLANMSHEIRTPMNGVLVMSTMLLDTNIDAAQRRYLQVICESGENLMVIINDILDFSKIEAGKLELESVDFDLLASLTSVTNALTGAARDKGLELRLEVDPELPATVRGDPVRFRQVLTNLVGNGVKFTPAGSVTITAGVRGGGGPVHVAVTDTGIGIDPAARATVLDAFGQADSSTTRRYGGTGLGLAICRQLLGMMGGVLDFSSRPGEGSTFWFEIPFAHARPAPAAAISPAAAPAPAISPAVAPVRAISPAAAPVPAISSPATLALVVARPNQPALAAVGTAVFASPEPPR